MLGFLLLLCHNIAMKQSLSHLPQRKTGELARIVSIIRDMAPQTEMIILFGSYARGDAVEDVTVEGHTTYEYSSDFDILALIKDKALADNIDIWNDIEDKAAKHPVQTSEYTHYKIERHLSKK